MQDRMMKWSDASRDSLVGHVEAVKNLVIIHNNVTETAVFLSLRSPGARSFCRYSTAMWVINGCVVTAAVSTAIFCSSPMDELLFSPLLMAQLPWLLQLQHSS